MKSLAKLPLIATTLLACTLITACGSGKKSSSPTASSSSSTSSSGSTKPTPITNKLAVKVEGLAGKLELSNGSDLLAITANGDAQFAKAVEVGISYNIQIVAQPENQLCSVNRPRGLMSASFTAINVVCSDGFGVELDITKPADLSLKNLQVMSNYQRVGGESDPALTVDSKIKTSQNSFVALRSNKDTKTYFISYVYGAGQTRLKLNAENTALALMVMEPSINDALNSHKLSVSAFFDLIAPLNAQNNRQLEGDLKKLADEISRQVDKNVDLYSAGAVLSPLIEKALIQALDKIANMPAVAADASAALAADSGVEALVENLADNKVKITFNNRRPRALAISGFKDQTSPLVLDGLASTSLEQTVEAGKFYSLSASIEGPGKIGTTKATATAYQAAILRSSLVDYFLPSLVYFTGGKNLNADLARQCLDADDEKALASNATALWSGVQAQLEQDAYFKPYHTLADKYRAYWADPAHMDVLISCPSLGLSALSQAEKQIAKTHLAILFKGYNQLREPAGVKEDLFRSAKQSEWVNAIINSAAQATWNYTNAFTLDIKAPAQVDDENEAAFSARCIDSSKKEVACTLTWTLEDTQLTGASIKYLFKKPASQFVNLVATGATGAQVSQSIQVSVARKGASIWVAKQDSTQALDSAKPLDFESVFVGTQLPFRLVLKNTGNAPLVISALSVQGAGFSVNLTSATIAVGAVQEFTVLFSPLEAAQYSATLTIVSNDKLLPSVNIALAGRGTPGVPVGKYTVTDDNIVREEVVARTNETAISGDEEFAQLRLLGSGADLFPQISLQLDNFNGPGIYSLNDTADRTCLALYSAAKDFTQQYCTTAKEGGSLVVTAISDSAYKVDYDFYAVNCTIPTGGKPCTPKVIQLRGTTQVEKAVLEPLASQPAQ
ncbi:MAG: choice-of-anchor D domain-containing protein [Marinagarivorans sp.]